MERKLPNRPFGSVHALRGCPCEPHANPSTTIPHPWTTAVTGEAAFLAPPANVWALSPSVRWGSRGSTGHLVLSAVPWHSVNVTFVLVSCRAMGQWASLDRLYHFSVGPRGSDAEGSVFVGLVKRYIYNLKVTANNFFIRAWSTCSHILSLFQIIRYFVFSRYIVVLYLEIMYLNT